LVVDDDPAMAAALCELLRESGYRPLGANSGPAALDIVKRHKPDLLISDLRMTEMTGHQLQVELSKLAPDLPVIIITAFGSIESAVESMKLGARDFITNPSGTRNSCRQFLA
jgi:DNA-binding NtrC family response regulator